MIRSVVSGILLVLVVAACNNPANMAHDNGGVESSAVVCTLEPKMVIPGAFPNGGETIIIDSVLFTISFWNAGETGETVYTGRWRSTDSTTTFPFNVPGGTYALSLEYYGAFGDDTLHYHDSRLLSIFPGNSFSITIDPTMIGLVTIDNEIDTLSYNVRYEVTGTVAQVAFVNSSHSGQNNNFEYDAVLPWSHSFATKSVGSFYVSSRFRMGDTGSITTAIYVDDVNVYTYTASCHEGDCEDVFSTALFPGWIPAIRGSLETMVR